MFAGVGRTTDRHRWWAAAPAAVPAGGGGAQDAPAGGAGGGPAATGRRRRRPDRGAGPTAGAPGHPWSAAAGAAAVALTAALFADWDTLVGPLAGAVTGRGFPLPGAVTTPWPDLAVLTAVLVAALHPLLRRGARTDTLPGAWSVPVTAFAAAGLAGAAAGLLAGGSAGGAAATVWHLLAQTGQGGLFGLLFGAPAAVAVLAAERLAPGARRGPAGAGGPRPGAAPAAGDPGGARTRGRSPYAALTAALLLLPTAVMGAGAYLLGTDAPGDCSPLACASPVDELLLNGEVGLRLAVPGWAAAVAVAAALRALPPTRGWPLWSHLLLAVGGTGLAVVLLSGLVVGSDV
ncbi:hypothetical protein ABZ234_05495 [Nocardiopsis sp. NPDC006198]|uniref:hypothetical protein n=1 Tax=Nocardiopsis sp. NPDC006198 TaxID=3154472 RepID=UPI0033AB7DBF